MKISNPLIAIAFAAALPLAVMAGDKDKSATTMGASSSAQFDKLDTNHDGRLSQSEAASDSTIVFSTVDKNGDGYLDSSEFAHRDMTRDRMPADPSNESPQPRN